MVRSSIELPDTVTVSDVQSPDLLVRLLRGMADKVSTLSGRLGNIENTPTSLTNNDLNHIQQSLQSSGTHPLNITDLRGIQGDVPAAVIPLPAVPVGLALQSYKNSQLILVTKTPLELWVIIGGNPNTIKKIV
jgi:hypothetical protein